MGVERAQPGGGVGQVRAAAGPAAGVTVSKKKNTSHR
jgi:hypothetical protein